jgi:hypothetical protein
VGAVSLQMVLSGLRMVAIFLVILAGRGRAHFFFGTTLKLIRELAYRLGKRLDDRKVYHLFPRYTFNDRVWSFVHVQYETSRRLRNDRQ